MPTCWLSFRRRCSVNGTSDSKPKQSILNSELNIERFNLIIKDKNKHGRVVAENH